MASNTVVRTKSSVGITKFVNSIVFSFGLKIIKHKILENRHIHNLCLSLHNNNFVLSWKALRFSLLQNFQAALGSTQPPVPRNKWFLSGGGDLERPASIHKLEYKNKNLRISNVACS